MGLEGVCKLVDDFLIGVADYTQLAEIEAREAIIRVQRGWDDVDQQQGAVGEKVSFAGYIIDRETQYADPKKVEAITKFPLPTCLKELRGWMGMCNQLNHYVPGLAGEQVTFRLLLKKDEPFIVTDKMVK